MNDLNREMQDYLDSRPDKAAEARQTAADAAKARKTLATNTIDLLFSHSDQTIPDNEPEPEPDEDPNAILRDIFH